MEIKRHIFNRLCDDLDDKRATLVVGARQVGKTFLLRKLEAFAQNKGLRTGYFDLEQPMDSARFSMSEADILETLKTAGDVVFIDEFHYLKNASHLLKAIYDSGAPVKIYASGSSAMDMHRHIKESLAGRKLVHRVYPCSLLETAGSTGSYESELLHHSVFGGMPGLHHLNGEADRKKLLEDILQSYVLKDVKSLIREENVRAFNALIYHLADRQGSLISGPSLAREVGMTARSIDSYIEILSQTYVAAPIYSYSNNLGNELKKSRKVYLYDQGIRNAVLKDFRSLELRPDRGAVVEGLVLNELLPHMTPEVELRFWRTKAGDEVDFVWVQNREPYPIEVKAGDTFGEIPKGLRAFLRRYPGARVAFVVHGGAEHIRDENGVRFVFIPIAKAGCIPTDWLQG